jgi:hypothetical protein
MARPRKLEALTTSISARVRPEQEEWLRYVAEARFEHEFSRTLRWAIDQAQVLDLLLREPDPVEAMDRMLHPEKYEAPHPDAEVIEAERELEAWRREHAIKQAQRRAKEAK